MAYILNILSLGYANIGIHYYYLCKKIPCGLYHKPITIVNNNSSIVNKLETSLIDDARVVIYDCHMFIVQATGLNLNKIILP